MYLTDFLFKELKDFFIGNNLSPTRAYQIFNWIYRKFVFDFSMMSDISKVERAFLNDNFNIIPLKLVEYTGSLKDESIKFLFKTEDNLFIETVLIIAVKEVENERLTLCVSSQIGCPLKCEFCATGKIEYKRNLIPSEIISQILLVESFIKNELKVFNPLGDSSLRHIGNIVFMGMGEPLLNTENILKAIDILTFSGGYNIGLRHITISTAGIIPEIEKLTLPIRLAISLHSPFQEIREKIMPIAKKYKLKDLIECLTKYQTTLDRRITFEYILLDNLNTRKEDVTELKKLLSGLKYNLNLINYNPIPESNFKPCSIDKINSFLKLLDEHNIPYVMRKSKGSNIYAGCGQLGLIKMKEM